ncbi:DUF423 domain-containing protein [Fulvivirga kasyanovii]|uniref:DUF423 domain-containing protein n=1 Tax=Fulvivirga kasyanovii TaxID=396812 RepID=A0ABW9RPU5_9BACT|nr:DUF423 domain-containing protein [Fulvivirga kasyanovii]MTI26041.1 DUF423 domain-containing protein [Fulvivirga kasyanovii]
MNNKNILIAAAVLGALSVAIGAFGAHGLKPLLLEHGRLDTFETAVKYQFYHTLAIFGLGILMLKYPDKHFKYSAVCMIAGIVIFSGSLYVLCLTNIAVLGAITPIGGVMFILGWIFMALGVRKAL